MQQSPAGRAPAEADHPIDRAHLERATFGDPALRREVLNLFLRQAPVLAAAIAAADGESARAEAAHRLRGAALGIGANRVAEAAAAFEPAAGGHAETARAIAQLTARLDEARADAKALLGD